MGQYDLEICLGINFGDVPLCLADFWHNGLQMLQNEDTTDALKLILIAFKKCNRSQSAALEMIAEKTPEIPAPLLKSIADEVYISDTNEDLCKLAHKCAVGKYCEKDHCLWPKSKWASNKGIPGNEGEISEDELKALPVAENPRLTVNLEPDNSITRYIKYGTSTCDAYPEYHYAMSLSLLSISTNRNLVLNLKQGSVYPNVWAFLLGMSTVSRKSAAMSKGQRFAEDLFPYGALPHSYSPEGLVEELSEAPRRYLFKDEAASMLEAMQKNYMLEMRDLYCILYDSQSYKRKLRSGQRKSRTVFPIDDPYINIVTATTPGMFREYTTLLDLTSGWLLRFLYFYPNYKKDWMGFKPVEKEDYNLYGEVLGRLAKVKGLLYGRSDPLEIQLSTEAWTYYSEWQAARESELQGDMDAIGLALWGRLSYYALKLAMLFTVGRADYSEGTQVSLEHIKEACCQVDEYFLPMGKLIAEEIAREETRNLQNKIIGTLNRAGGKMLRRDLLRVLHATLKDVDAATEALIESEEIRIVHVKGGGNKPKIWVCTVNGRNNHNNRNSLNSPNSHINSSDTLYITETNETNATFETEETVETEPSDNSDTTPLEDHPDDKPHAVGPDHSEAPTAKPKMVKVRFKHDVPAFVGVDGLTYGPYGLGQTAALPDINAKNFVDKGVAVLARPKRPVSQPKPDKYHCSKCGRDFEYELTYWFDGTKSAYICGDCGMGHPPLPQATRGPNKLGGGEVVS
jgi:hypothetical protein